MTAIRITWPEHVAGTLGELLEDAPTGVTGRPYGVAVVRFPGSEDWPVGHPAAYAYGEREDWTAVNWHTDNFERI